MTFFRLGICFLLLISICQHTSAQIRIYAFASHEWLNDRNKDEVNTNPAREESGENFYLAVERINSSFRATSYEAGIGLSRKRIEFYETKATVANLESISPRIYLKGNSYIIGKFLSINGKLEFMYDRNLKGITELYKPAIFRVSFGPSIMPVKRVKVFFNWTMTALTKYRGHEAGVGYYFYQFNK